MSLVVENQQIIVKRFYHVNITGAVHRHALGAHQVAHIQPELAEFFHHVAFSIEDLYTGIQSVSNVEFAPSESQVGRKIELSITFSTLSNYFQQFAIVVEYLDVM
jgi:hypothetical protein